MLGSTMKNLVLFFLLAQIGATPLLRIGSVGRTLTSQDIEAVVQALPSGAKPWLISAESPRANLQQVEVYLEPSSATLALRRGSVVTVNRQAASAGQAWNARQSEEYAQVAIPGRAFGAITGDQDLNRPFRVTGQFEDAELIRLVNLVRSIAVPPAGSVNDQLSSRNVLLLPIHQVCRRDSLTVQVNLRIESMKEQTVMLEKRGDDWVVVSVQSRIA
jgi:hypothetical protein